MLTSTSGGSAAADGPGGGRVTVTVYASVAPFAAVTVILMTSSPGASVTWNPVAPPTSVSALSSPSKYATVAPRSVGVGVTVTSVTEFATAAA